MAVSGGTPLKMVMVSGPLIPLLLMLAAAAGYGTRIDYPRALTIVKQRHFDLRAAAVEHRVEREVLSRSWRRFLPTLTFSGSALNEVVMWGNDTRQYTLRMTADQTLFDGGAAWAEHRVLVLETAMGQHRHRRLLRRLTAQVQQAYIRFIAEREAVRLLNDQVRFAKVQVRYAAAERTAGVITRLDYLELRDRLHNSRLSLRKRRSSVNDLRDDFLTLINLSSERSHTIIGDLRRCVVFGSPPRLNPGALTQHALERREDRREAGLKLLKARHSRDAAVWSALPQVGLELSSGLSDDRFWPNTWNWGASLSISMNLWGNTVESSTSAGQTGTAKRSFSGESSLTPAVDPGYMASRLKARLAYRRAALEYERQEESIRREITRAYRKLHETWAVLRLSADAKARRMALLRVQRTKYRIGEGKRTDLMEAKIETVAKQLAAIQALTSYVKAAGIFETALGRPLGSMRLVSIRGEEN
jgi:outer membrane protein TolC